MSRTRYDKYKQYNTQPGETFLKHPSNKFWYKTF